MGGGLANSRHISIFTLLIGFNTYDVRIRGWNLKFDSNICIVFLPP